MDDELLRALGRSQREDLEAPPDAAPADPRWDELLEPFDDDTREQLLDAVFEQVAATTSPTREREPAPVIDLSARRRWSVVGLLISAAAAVGLGIWWARDTTNPTRDAVALLPDYTTSSLHGGQASQRSDPRDSVEALRMRSTEAIDWVVTPAEPIRESITVALLAEPTSGPALFVAKLDAQISESGAVRLRGPLDRFVALTPGSWTLTLLIAGSDQPPAELAELNTEASATWQRVSVRVNIVGQ